MFPNPSAGMPDPDNSYFVFFVSVRYPVLVNFKGMITAVIISSVFIQRINSWILGEVSDP
jgi:hypothetical protein